MIHSPQISIIIPTYNHGTYIRKAVDSALSQTYKDFEIIVVDDGSTDNTSDIIKGYGDRIKYIYQPNQGLASARNTGIRASQGQSICFLDADDWFTEDNLEVKITFMRDHPEAVWIYSDWQYVDEINEYIEKGSERFKYARKKLNGYIFEELLFNRNFISPCTAIVKKTVLEEVGLFDPDVLCQEDLDLWLRISLRYPASYIDRVLVFVTVHPGSLSTDFTKWVNGNAVIVDKLRKSIPSDFKNKERILKKIIADKHTFLGRDHFQRRQFKQAIISFRHSIKCLPLQKRVYWLMARSVFRLILAGFCRKRNSEQHR